MSERSLDEIYLLIVDLTKSIGEVKEGQEELRGEMKLGQAGTRSDVAEVGRRVGAVETRLGNGHGLESRIKHVESWVDAHPEPCLFAQHQGQVAKEKEAEGKERDRRRYHWRDLVRDTVLVAIVGMLSFAVQKCTEIRIEQALTPPPEVEAPR